MKIRVALLFLVGSVLFANSGSAGVMTYSLTTNPGASPSTLSGTLNGVAFSNKTFTITADADSSSFTNYPQGPFISKFVTANATMTIQGLAPFQITETGFGIAYLNATPMGPHFGGFTNNNGDIFNGKRFLAQGSLSGDPLNLGSISGDFGVKPAAVLSTTAGDLIVTGSNGGNTAVFTSVLSGGSSSVPEPGTIGIFSLGALGMAYRLRRVLLRFSW